MTMFSVLLFTVTALLACGSISVSSAQLDYLPNSLLQDFLGHITSDQHTGDSFENGAINNGLFIADGHVADVRLVFSNYIYFQLAFLSRKTTGSARTAAMVIR